MASDSTPITRKREFNNGEEIEEEESTAIIFAANLRMAEIFYLGGGIKNYTGTGYEKNPHNEPATDADLAEVEWRETVFGAGILTGAPGDLQFKVEYSMASSPEVTASSDGQTYKNIHQETDVSTLIAELKTGAFFIGYTAATTTVAKASDTAYNDGFNKEVTDSRKLGAGYINDEGLMISVYSTVDKSLETSSDEGGGEGGGEGDVKSENAIMEVNVGFNF